MNQYGFLNSAVYNFYMYLFRKSARQEEGKKTANGFFRKMKGRVTGLLLVGATGCFFDPPPLVLDEPSAGVDAGSEKPDAYGKDAGKGADAPIPHEDRQDIGEQQPDARLVDAQTDDGAVVIEPSPDSGPQDGTVIIIRDAADRPDAEVTDARETTDAHTLEDGHIRRDAEDEADANEPVDAHIPDGAARDAEIEDAHESPDREELKDVPEIADSQAAHDGAGQRDAEISDAFEDADGSPADVSDAEVAEAGIDTGIEVDGGLGADGGIPDSGVVWADSRSPFCRDIAISGSYPAGYTHTLIIPPGFDYANARGDLADLVFTEGTCTTATVAERLPFITEELSIGGESKIAVRTRNPNVWAVALFYGSLLPNQFTPHDTYVAFAAGRDLSAFMQVNTRQAFSIANGRVQYVNYPWGNGVSGTGSFIYKDVGPLGGFTFDITVQYDTQNEGTRPYMMFGVFDTLGFDAINHQNGVGVYRRDVGAQNALALRIAQGGTQTFPELASINPPASRAIAQAGTPYYVRLKHAGNSVSIAYYTSRLDRANEANEVFSTAVNNATLGQLQYVYMLVGLDVADPSRAANGWVNDLTVRKLVVPEPQALLGSMVYTRP